LATPIRRQLRFVKNLARERPMWRWALATAALLLAAAHVPESRSDSLVNAGFEVPALGSGYKYNPTGTGVGWTFSANSGIEHNGSAFNAATAPEGSQAAFVQRTGSISQSVNLGAGSYVLSFKAAQRACCSTPYAQPVRVTVDGAQIGSLVSPSSTSFAAFSIAFTLSSTGQHVLAFAGTDSADKTSFIDAITLSTGGLPTSTTTVASSLNPSTAGAGVTFTAAVSGVAPTGSVAFTADGAALAGCNAVPLPSGGTNSKNVTCSTSALAAGTHAILAAYSGDAGNQGSASVALSQLVNPVPGALTNPGFEVPALGSGHQYNPTGTGIGWRFSSNSGIEHNGSAFNAATAPEGSQAAFVQRTGSMSQTLNLGAGNYTLSFKAAQRACCTSPYPQPVRVTVDGAQIGSLVSPASTAFAAFSVPFSIASAGAHTIGFAGTDAGDKTTFIDAVTLAPGTLVASSTAISSSLNPSALGAAVTFTATTTGSAPTGSIAFSADGVVLAGCAGVALPAGSANSKSVACGTASLAAGTHAIVATYSGDAGNASSASTALSQVVSTVKSQTISFAPIPRQVLGTAFPTLSATASSGLAVAFTSLTAPVCIVGGTTVTLLALGACTIQATQPGNAAYSAASPVSRSFVVMAAAQFSGPLTYATGTFPSGAAIGDFNGDGIPDLAVANAFSARVSILLGAGSGTFVPGIDVQGVGEPIAVAVADFNHDGKVDLAVGDFWRDGVYVLTGKGDGTFTMSATLPLGPAPNALAVADLNGDGNTDLVVVNGTRSDVTGSTVTIALGKADGSFGAPSTYATGRSPYAVVVADFNADGKPDLVVANGDDGTISLLLGRGDGTFGAAVAYAAHTYPDALAVGDFDGDGKLDLAVANDYSNDISILLGRGDGTFRPAVSVAAGDGPASVAVADLNGDGSPDLVVANRFDNTVAILLGNGDGTFQPPSIYESLGGQLETIVARDLNNDGKPDLIVTSAATNAVAVMLNWTISGAPASLAIVSGGAQSSATGTSFAEPLAIVVKDASGHPLGGVPVTFTAPAAGASGTFAGSGTVARVATNTAGIANAPTLTANALVGSFTVTASAAALSASFGLTNTAPTGSPPSFTTGPLPAGTVSVAYDYVLSASGTPAPTFSVSSPGLPPGLSLNAVTGEISGTPSATGTFGGTFTASNGFAPNATQSFSVTVAAIAQTIAFPALPGRTFGDQPFVVIATASSGLPVSLASLTPSVCAAIANSVSIAAAGTCTIRASQSGNATYGPAPSVEQSFAVAPASQSIAFQAVIGASLDKPRRDLYASASSGLPVQLVSLSPLVCVVSGALASFVAVGTCTLRASQPGNANYNAAPDVDQNVAVAMATQTITFWTPDAHAVGAPFPLDATASSGLPVSFGSLTPTICTVVALTANPIAAGTCTIRASQAGNASYGSATADRSFVVTQLPTGSLPATGPPPFLFYSTFLGSSGGDSVFDVVVGPDGSAYVGGSTAATDLPGLSSATFTNAGLDLLYVTKLRTGGGGFEFTTVIGGRSPRIDGTGGLPYVGSLQDGLGAYLGGGQVEAMAGDAAGNVYVAAYANGTSFPAAGGTYVRAGPKALFKLSSSGTVQTVTSSIDPAVMTIRALAVDASGAIYFTGVAGPGLATTAGAVIRTMPAPTGPYWTQTAPYLIKLAPDGGSVIFSTYLSLPGSRSSLPADPGQSLMDSVTTAYALAVDASGNIFVAGQATADEFPVTPGSPDTPDAKNRDAFVAKLSPVGTALIFVARLGGRDAERATSVALSPDGGILIGGKTATQPFVGSASAIQSVVSFGLQTPLIDRETGFVAKLSADGKQWLGVAAIGTEGGSLVANWSPDASPYPVKVAVDSAGAIYVTGTTWTDRTLPLLSNLSDVHLGGAFVIKMSSDLTKLIYSTTLGDGVAAGLALDSFGNAFVAGYDNAAIPAINASQAAPLPGEASPGAFLAKLNDQSGPIALASDQNPAVAGRPVALRMTLADARGSGVAEFDDGGQVIGSVALASGSATLSTTLAVGIHRLRAVFHGDGVLDGYASPELLLVVNQP